MIGNSTLLTRGVNLTSGYQGARRPTCRFQRVYLKTFSTKNADRFPGEFSLKMAEPLRVECDLELRCFISFEGEVNLDETFVIKGKDGRYHNAWSVGHFREKDVQLVSIEEDS